MLVQDLLKNTDKHHPDYSNIQTALSKMKEFADSINERKRATDKVFQIKDYISGAKV